MLIIVFATALTLFCIVITFYFNWYDKIGWNYDYATAWATNPNISAPGDASCCSGVISIEPQNVSPIGSKIETGYLDVLVVTAGPISDPTIDLEDNQILWAIDFILFHNGTGNPHYGGPLFEAQLQGMDEEYELVSTKPDDLTMVLELLPGETIQGRLIYAVPDSDTSLYWIYTNRMTGYPHAIFQVR